MGLDLESEPRPRNLVCSIYKALCDRTPVQNSNVYHVCKCMFQVSCLPFIWTSAVLWLLVRMAGSWWCSISDVHRECALLEWN